MLVALQAKIKELYRDKMVPNQLFGSKTVPSVIYFRRTPTKRVFISVNLAQLKSMAYKAAVDHNSQL